MVNTNLARKLTVVPASSSVNVREVKRYFEYSMSDVEALEDGLKEVCFGEYLVDQGVIDRFQLFRALQLQDRSPGVRLGECAAALGYAPINAIERFFERYIELKTLYVA